jgi:hypothetical protein
VCGLRVLTSNGTGAFDSPSVCSQYEVPPSGHNSTWEAQATGVAEEHGGRPCAQRERFSPPDQGPYCAHILQLWPVMACYGLGMRQPAHGCNVRAKRLTHWLLTSQFAQQLCCSLCQQDWLAITGSQAAADLRQTRPVCSPDESRSRRYSPRVSRSMPELPSTKDFHDEGRVAATVDQTRPAALLFPCFTRLHICSMCIYMRTNEQPTRHRACILVGES